MTAVASFSLVGDLAMLQKLERLAAAARGKALETAVVAGCLPILNRAKTSAQSERVTSPDNTGNLARSLHIGGHQGLEAPTTGTDIGGAQVGPERVVLYIGTNVESARRVELGFVGKDKIGRTYNQPPYPYLRPAFDEKRGEAMTEMAAVLRQQVRRAVA